MGRITPHDLKYLLVYVFVLIVSVTLHEFGHAIMADKLGDDTPRRQGRVTLNPVAHVDPIGTLLLPLVGGLIALQNGGRGGGFGWGRPVQWLPSRVNRKWKMTTASILVSIAGPAMNVVLAIAIAGVHSILLMQGVVSPASEVHGILVYATLTNFILFFFNLVPAPPLDGGHVAQNLMPYSKRKAFDEYAKYGMFVVMAVATIPLLAKIFIIPARFCAHGLYALMGVQVF